MMNHSCCEKSLKNFSFKNVSLKKKRGKKCGERGKEEEKQMRKEDDKIFFKKVLCNRKMIFFRQIKKYRYTQNMSPKTIII